MLILFEPSNHPLPVYVGKEGRFSREVKDHEERDASNHHGSEAFEDEDPSPPPLSAHAIHVFDSCSEQSTKRSRQRRGRKEYGSPDTELFSLVPAAQVVVDTWKETRLGQTQEESRGHQALEIVRQAHASHASAPEHHDAGDKDPGSKALQQDVGQWLR